MINHSNISFIITTFKSENIIEKLLSNLPKDSEKIICENSENFFLKKKLESTFSNLKCFVNKNIGYGAANNIGFKNAKNEYIFILNPDVNLNIEKLNEILEILEKEKDFAVAAPYETSEFKKYKNSEIIVQRDEVKGFAMIINRKTLDELYFDENIFLYLEEIDFCKRVKKLGKKIINIKVFLDHSGGGSHGNFNEEMELSRNWHWMWSQFYYSKKYKGYFLSFIIFIPQLILNFLKYFLSFSNFKKKKNKFRFLGLLNSILLNKSFHRPNQNKIKRRDGRVV